MQSDDPRGGFPLSPELRVGEVLGLDCTRCGACCREASDGRVLVAAEDLVRWKRAGRDDLVEATVDGHFGERAFASRADGACVHFRDDDGRTVCAIYEERGTTCREFAAGSWQCLEFRRERGIG